MVKLPFINKNTEKDKTAIKPGQNLLAIDIGTEYLKTLLFNVTDLGVEIQKNSRIQQQQHAMSKGVIQNLNTVIENCKLSVQDLTDDLEENEIPEYVTMGIAGEFVQGVSITVNYERDEHFDDKVNKKEQDKIINEVYNKIIASGKSDLARRTGLMEDDIEILHVTITGMEIGGMPVESLVGFRGRNLRLYFYASFAPKTFVESLNTLSDTLNLNMLGLVSQPFAVARAFSGSRNKDFSAIFIDIGGGTTDIAVVNRGNVVDTQMFAFGGRVWTKEIAKEMNLDYRYAESRKIKYSNRELDKKMMSQVKEITYNVSQLWMTSLQSAFEMCEDIEVFPSQIYLCGGGSLLPDVKNVMMEFPWTRLLPFASIPKVTLFMPNQLGEIFDKNNELKSAYDITPAALTKFGYDKIKHPELYFSN